MRPTQGVPLQDVVVKQGPTAQQLDDTCFGVARSAIVRLLQIRETLETVSGGLRCEPKDGGSNPNTASSSQATLTDLLEQTAGLATDVNGLANDIARKLGQ